jgi:hypothetical protein
VSTSTTTPSGRRSLRGGEPTTPQRGTAAQIRDAFRRLQERRPDRYGTIARQPRRRLAPQ